MTSQRSHFEADRDALTDAAEAANLFAVCGGERRVDGSEKERARQADTLEEFGQDARLQCFDVDGDVGELGHQAPQSVGGFAVSKKRVDFNTAY
jgi:hypothetical protein